MLGRAREQVYLLEKKGLLSIELDQRSAVPSAFIDLRFDPTELTHHTHRHQEAATLSVEIDNFEKARE